MMLVAVFMLSCIMHDCREIRCFNFHYLSEGLRARMGAGYSQMNDLTIIQTAQGFVKYMEQIGPDVKAKGVVIGYDARYNSRR